MTSDARILTALPSHPKTKKLIRRIGAGGAWHLICLFLWAAANRSDGDLSGMTDEDIELAVDWSGESGKLVSVMTEVGFLDGSEGSRCIHDWAEHNPWASGSEKRSAKARWNAVKRHHGEQEADRQVPEYAAIRKQSVKAEDADSNASSMLHAVHNYDDSSAPSPSPSPSPSEKIEPSVPVPGDAGDQPQAGIQATVVGIDSKREAKAQRLAEVTNDAVETYNLAPFTKRNGGACPNVTLVNDVRRKEVKRCVETAALICQSQYGSTTITRRFWEDYWATADADDFHSGRQRAGPGHENWTPDFEFLTRPEVMTKLFDRAMSKSA